MLAVAVLQLLGLIALGALVSLIILPFVFRLLNIIAYALTLKLLKTFPNLTKKPVRCSDSTKYEIGEPSYIHSIRSVGISKKNGQPKPINDFDDRGYYEDRPNNSRLYLTQQPITTRVNKILNGFHRIIVFYKRFWCVNHSGKEPIKCRNEGWIVYLPNIIPDRKG